MGLNKLRALKDFEDQDGAFKKGDEFEVNDERAYVLTATERAERVTSAVAPAVEPEAASETPRKSFGVPKKRSAE